MSQKNALYQARWYERQKNNGIVYGLLIGDLLYVGSTTNSLNKRLWQHRSGSLASTKKAIDTGATITIFELERLTDPTERQEREQFWIDELLPDLNYTGTIARKGGYKKRKERLNFLKEDGV